MVLRRALPFSLCALVAILITGCGSHSTFGTPVTGNSRYSGSVHGGQQPVAGASIQLYTVGTTADGSAATPLLTSTVTSDATGSFTITGLYSCTNATQVYIVATGGNPGLSTANPNIALMAALGPCSSLTPSTFISINELTTVAALAALAPYMNSLSAIGSSPSDATALANAFTLANEYVNTTTAAAPGTNVPSGYTVPTDELNTLADILSACINSTGGVAGDGSLCGQLFSLTTVSPNPAPTNTIAALLNIVNDPSQNASALFALAPPTPPFQPTLTSAPSSWQIQLIPPPDSGPVTLTSSASFTILGALQDLTLSNQGNTPLAITSITEADSGPPSTPAFAIAANNCGTSLPAQSSCTISVVSAHSPQGVQPITLTGTITVNDNAASGPQIATLTSADAYEIAAYNYPLPEPSSGIVSFLADPVGTSENAPQTIFYMPYASGAIAPPIPLTFGGSNPGDFSATTYHTGVTPTSTSCAYNYANSNSTPGECQIIFAFKPTAAGPRSARVSLDPSYGTPTGQYILLQGTGVASGPRFRLDTSSLSLQNFLPGNIDPNSTGSATITVTNIGNTTISLAASFNGSAAPYLTASVANCSSVAAQATCQFSVRFNAPTAGTYSGNLVVSDTSSSFSLTLPITATSSYWRPVANPNQLSFGNQTTGTMSTAKTFVIADADGYPIGDAYTVALKPSSNFMLTQGSTCPASTTQTCTLGIAFAPQTNGAINEVATITDQTTGLQSQLALSGNGGGPTYTLSTNAIVFAPAATGSTSAATTITLTANGTQSINISAISIAGAVNNNFTETNNCSTVATNSSCTIGVTFAPTAAGAQAATLQITSNAVNSPSSVTLSGTAFTGGSSPILQISPSSIAFPPSSTGVASPAQLVTINNTGSGSVTISSVAVTGATGASFAISGNNCVAILSPGGSCALSLTATPSATTGSGSLVITSSTPDSPQSIPLSTTTTSSGGSTTATLTPTSAAFNIWGANEDFTLTNTGSLPLLIGATATDTTHGMAQAHNYALANTTCGSSLAAAASCTFGVTSLPVLPISDYPTYFGVGTGDFYVQDGVGQQSVSFITHDGAYLWANGVTTPGIFNDGLIPGVVTFPGNQVGSTQTATIQFANELSGSPAASLTIAGANPGDFSVSAIEPSVSPNASNSCPGTGTAPCSITITFKPTALGTRSAKISLDSGSSSTSQYFYVTVTNTGNTTLNLASSLIGANPSSFTVDTSQCNSVAPQATCAVHLTFFGTTVGSYSATLFLYDTSSNASTTIYLSGSTNYQSPAGSLWYPLGPAVSYYQFPSQQVNTLSAPLTFTVTDRNGYPLDDPISISVTSGNDLVLPDGGYCPAGTQPCTVVVQFDPQKTGTLADSLTFTDTVTGSINIVQFIGTGIQ